ncbi:MAG: hypothetical protein ACRC7C_17810 [Beijerinckiaceae bacterium]
MTSKQPNSVERRMEYVEITQAEEMPVLDAAEKAELLASLEEARAQLARGDGILFESGADLGDWICRQFDDAIMRHHGSKS